MQNINGPAPKTQNAKYRRLPKTQNAKRKTQNAKNAFITKNYKLLYHFFCKKKRIYMCKRKTQNTFFNRWQKMAKIKNALQALCNAMANIILFGLVVLAWLLCFL